MPTQDLPIGTVQNQPTTFNPLATHRFSVVIRRLPGVSFEVQECNLPGMNMGNATQPTPLLDLPIYGDKVRYNDFFMKFIVDEGLQNYKQIANWFIGLGFPRQYGQYADLVTSEFSMGMQSDHATHSDISLFLQDGSLQPTHNIVIHDAFPVSISDLMFSTKVEDTEQQVVEVTFKYAYWSFEDLNTTDDTSLTEADRLHG